MKLNTKRDIEAPVDFVFAALTEFDAWERAAMRSGAEVERLATGAEASPAWNIRFTFRGKNRRVQISVIENTPRQRLGFAMIGTVLDGHSTLDLLPLSARRTRLVLSLTVKPKTLAARLFVHSLKLARRRVMTRLDQRLAHLAQDIEARYRQDQLMSARG